MLHERLVKSAFEVVCHGGYITSQLAGVTIPRALFNNTLRLIVRLRRGRARRTYDYII